VIDTIPPFLQASARFLAAGAILLAIGRARGLAWPALAEWRTAAVVGVLMLTGETARFAPADVTAASLAALAYLVVFVSLIGFTAYLFLLHHTTPARATACA
jgi:drug/metabolite transporter (DMT)-like permease